MMILLMVFNRCRQEQPAVLPAPPCVPHQRQHLSARRGRHSNVTQAAAGQLRRGPPVSFDVRGQRVGQFGPAASVLGSGGGGGADRGQNVGTSVQNGSAGGTAEVRGVFIPRR